MSAKDPAVRWTNVGIAAAAAVVYLWLFGWMAFNDRPVQPLPSAPLSEAIR